MVGLENYNLVSSSVQDAWEYLMASNSLQKECDILRVQRDDLYILGAVRHRTIVILDFAIRTLGIFSNAFAFVWILHYLIITSLF